MDDVGIDIVSNDYIKRNLTDSFLRLVHSEEEIERYRICDNKVNMWLDVLRRKKL